MTQNGPIRLATYLEVLIGCQVGYTPQAGPIRLSLYLVAVIGSQSPLRTPALVEAEHRCFSPCFC